MARVDVHNYKQWLTVAWQSSYDASLLSQNLKTSPRQLIRYTQELFGRSPQEWLDEHRLMLAGGMLRKHRSVKTVAFQLGFKQASHFSREFKLHYGLSPKEFIIWSDGQEKK